MIIACDFCGTESDKLTGHVNRARKLGYGVYCDRKCSGAAKRVNKDAAEKKREKQQYDREYRAKNRALLKAKKAAYFKKDYDANPEKYKKARIRNRDSHIKCINKPEYKAYKRNYDQKYLANKKYGEFAEAMLVLREIENLIDKRVSRQDRDCHNKTQKRKKLWKNLQPST